MARSFHKTSFACILGLTVGLLLGCGPQTSTPLERAESLFVHSQFEETLRTCDEAIALTEDAQELSGPAPAARTLFHRAGLSNATAGR